MTTDHSAAHDYLAENIPDRPELAAAVVVAAWLADHPDEGLEGLLWQAGVMLTRADVGGLAGAVARLYNAMGSRAGGVWQGRGGLRDDPNIRALRRDTGTILRNLTRDDPDPQPPSTPAPDDSITDGGGLRAAWNLIESDPGRYLSFLDHPSPPQVRPRPASSRLRPGLAGLLRDTIDPAITRRIAKKRREGRRGDLPPGKRGR